MPRIPVITRCRLQTADRIQNVDKVQSVDCRLQSGYKVQTENLKSFFVWYVIKSSCNLPSVTQSPFRDQLSRLFGSYENEDPENDDLRPPYEDEDLLRKRRPPTKTKPITKTKTPLRKRRHMVLPLWIKIMFMRHTTKTKILTEILNSEFGTSVIYYGIFQQ